MSQISNDFVLDGISDDNAGSEKVVKLEQVEPEIALITMNDRVNKNTFSQELSVGLFEAFESVGQNQDYKAVILTGFDTYFCSGGTQGGLLAINDRKLKFTDNSLFNLPLNCPIPVISAMQGHGIGGGFIFGMFADFIILSRESIYNINCMKYGFTPGFGSTYILPIKMGHILACEILMTAKNYRGAELAERGISIPVYPRNLVLEEALKLARDLAKKPRISLVMLKEQLSKEIKLKLPAAVEQELIMHDTTFHLPEVKQRISQLFGN